MASYGYYPEEEFYNEENNYEYNESIPVLKTKASMLAHMNHYIISIYKGIDQLLTMTNDFNNSINEERKPIQRNKNLFKVNILNYLFQEKDYEKIEQYVTMLRVRFFTPIPDHLNNYIYYLNNDVVSIIMNEDDKSFSYKSFLPFSNKDFYPIYNSQEFRYSFQLKFVDLLIHNIVIKKEIDLKLNILKYVSVFNPQDTIWNFDIGLLNDLELCGWVHKENKYIIKDGNMIKIYKSYFLKIFAEIFKNKSLYHVAIVNNKNLESLLIAIFPFAIIRENCNREILQREENGEFTTEINSEIESSVIYIEKYYFDTTIKSIFDGPNNDPNIRNRFQNIISVLSHIGCNISQEKLKFTYTYLKNVLIESMKIFEENDEEFYIRSCYQYNLIPFIKSTNQDNLLDMINMIKKHQINN